MIAKQEGRLPTLAAFFIVGKDSERWIYVDDAELAGGEVRLRAPLDALPPYEPVAEDLRLQPVRVKDLFDEILPLIAPEAQKNNVRVEVHADSNAGWVNGDAAMLRQAFLNLAINGCQAMPNGGTLRMSSSAAARNRIQVRFEDKGIGIPAEHLSKIFDLYFTTKDHGTGIGLSMVYRIVQLHDGEVEVESTKGRGTTFRVLLPRANEA